MSLTVRQVDIDPLDALMATDLNVGPRELSEIEKLSQIRWIFNPDQVLDVAHRNIGFNEVARVRLQPVKNRIYKDQPDRFDKDPGTHLQEQPMYAAWIKDELITVYAPSYVIDIEPFTGIEDRKLMAEIQRIFLPNYPTTTLALIDELELAPGRIKDNESRLESLGLKHNILDLVERTEQAVILMQTAAFNALEYQQEYIDRSVLDRENYRESGKKSYDDRDKGYFFLLEREIPELGNATRPAQSSNQSNESLVTTLKEGISEIFTNLADNGMLGGNSNQPSAQEIIQMASMATVQTLIQAGIVQPQQPASAPSASAAQPVNSSAPAAQNSTTKGRNSNG